MARARSVSGLECDKPFRDGARRMLSTRFEEMMSFRDQVFLASDDAAGHEAVHDMRVASRRLRAALEACSDAFPRKAYRPILKSVKELADSLGAVRDIDVLCERLTHDRRLEPAPQKAVIDGILAGLEPQRQGARRRLTNTIQHLDRGDLPARFTSLLESETD